MPRFQGQVTAREEAIRWAKEKHAEFSELREKAAARIATK
jgi:hypothetical protein